MAMDGNAKNAKAHRERERVASERKLKKKHRAHSKIESCYIVQANKIQDPLSMLRRDTNANVQCYGYIAYRLGPNGATHIKLLNIDQG